MPAEATIAKNIIAIGSGKGGVGKSTVAVNLALALKEEGASVAFLDADLYGPSAPTMFGLNGEIPKVGQNGTLYPIEKFGIKVMSIGFLLPEGEAVIWRGPMQTKMLQQFLGQVEWGYPNYLVVDLPPGTGDVQLSLSQMIPLTGGIIVTTPQDVALADVKRSVRMFEKTGVSLLGVIENMSYFEAPDTGKRYMIFGGGPDKQKLAALGTEVIGEIPLEIPTRESSDTGQPIVVTEPQSAQAGRFRQIAQKIIAAKASADSKDEIKLPDLSEAYQ